MWMYQVVIRRLGDLPWAFTAVFSACILCSSMISSRYSRYCAVRSNCGMTLTLSRLNQLFRLSKMHNMKVTHPYQSSTVRAKIWWRLKTPEIIYTNTDLYHYSPFYVYRYVISLFYFYFFWVSNPKPIMSVLSSCILWYESLYNGQALVITVLPTRPSKESPSQKKVSNTRKLNHPSQGGTIDRPDC